MEIEKLKEENSQLKKDIEENTTKFNEMQLKCESLTNSNNQLIQTYMELKKNVFIIYK